MTAVTFVSVGEIEDPAALLVDFLNTLDIDDETDVLDDDAGWQAWLRNHGLTALAGTQVAGMVRPMRDDLRVLARGDASREVNYPVVVTTGRGGVGLGATTPTGLMAALVARLAIEGRLNRVKICPADDCRWAFYDVSRNGSRQWCSMEVCGNRAKARNHRARATGSADQGSSGSGIC